MRRRAYAFVFICALAACHRPAPPVPAIRAARVATDVARPVPVETRTDTVVVAGVKYACTYAVLSDSTMQMPSVAPAATGACGAAFLAWVRGRQPQAGPPR
jgi:hypothetical protein